MAAEVDAPLHDDPLGQPPPTTSRPSRCEARPRGLARSPAMTRRLFVVATDAGVGKTTVAAAPLAQAPRIPYSPRR